MKTRVHAVFPPEHKELLYQSFSNSNVVELDGYDSDFEAYAQYVLNAPSDISCNIVVISVFNHLGDDRFVNIVNEVADIAVSIRFACPNLRMIFILPEYVDQHELYANAVKKMYTTGITELQFSGDFSFGDIEQWILNNPNAHIAATNYQNTPQQELQKAPIQESRINTAAIELQTQDIPVDETPVKEPSINVEPPLIEEPIKPVNKGKSLFKKTAVPPKTDDSLNAVNVDTFSKKIGIVGLTGNVGTTLITTNLAAYIGSKYGDVAVYENPVADNHTYLADWFFFFNEDVPKDSLPHAITREVNFDLTHGYNKSDNVTYYPVNYTLGQIENFSPQHFSNYVNTGQHTVKICDLGNLRDFHAAPVETLTNMKLFDVIMLVIDPIPLKLTPNVHLLLEIQQHLKNNNIHFEFVLNQYNNEFPKADLKKFGISNCVSIPSFDRASVLNSIYKNKTLYEYDGATRKKLTQQLSELEQKLQLFNIPSKNKKKIFSLR